MTPVNYIIEIIEYVVSVGVIAGGLLSAFGVACCVLKCCWPFPNAKDLRELVVQAAQCSFSNGCILLIVLTPILAAIKIYAWLQ